jgi:hypothetical protein
MVSPKDLPAGRRGPRKPAVRRAAASGPGADTLVVTLRVGDGSVLKIEGVQADGARRELTAAEAATLLGDRPGATVQGLVQEAFEAGIVCILDDEQPGAPDEASGESQEDSMLHDELLDALIEHSPARRLLQRDVLNSALLRTIINGATGAAPAS